MSVFLTKKYLIAFFQIQLNFDTAQTSRHYSQTYLCQTLIAVSSCCPIAPDRWVGPPSHSTRYSIDASDSSGRTRRRNRIATGGARATACRSSHSSRLATTGCTRAWSASICPWRARSHGSCCAWAGAIDPCSCHRDAPLASRVRQCPRCSWRPPAIWRRCLSLCPCASSNDDPPFSDRTRTTATRIEPATLGSSVSKTTTFDFHRLLRDRNARPNRTSSRVASPTRRSLSPANCPSFCAAPNRVCFSPRRRAVVWWWLRRSNPGSRRA